MAFTSFVDHAVSISNSDFCICKFKLIAFLGNYSTQHQTRPSPRELEGVATRD